MEIHQRVCYCMYNPRGNGRGATTDYLYIGDEKKKSSRFPPALLLSPDSRKYLCGSKQSFEEGGGGTGGE